MDTNDIVGITAVFLVLASLAVYAYNMFDLSESEAEPVFEEKATSNARRLSPEQVEAIRQDVQRLLRD